MSHYSDPTQALLHKLNTSVARIADTLEQSEKTSAKNLALIQAGNGLADAVKAFMTILPKDDKGTITRDLLQQSLDRWNQVKD
jgi:hypothetical protein